MSRRLGCAVLFVALAGWLPMLPSVAAPFWYKWDGSRYPEEDPGWFRLWGNHQGPQQGQSNRTLINGTLEFNNVHDVGLYDGVHQNFYGTLNPAPGEVFIAKWRLRVDQVVGNPIYPYDPSLGLFGDDGWGTGFSHGVDRVKVGIFYSTSVIVPFAPYVFHAYEMRTWDMRTFEFYLDGNLAHVGPLDHPVTSGYVAWGDSVVGSGSKAAWDYFEMGVRTEVPEPSGLMMAIMLALHRARWSRSK